MTESESKPLVLVLDDQEAGRFVKTQILQRAGFEIFEAATGAQALALCRVHQFDLALLDVNLPDIHGFEVSRRLKTEYGGPPAIQILQISNTAITDADRVRGLDGGADVYLVEPVAPEVLVATAHALLRVRRSEKALAAALERERAARQEADEANRLKDDFLAMLSHELRTPLHAMMGWVALLKRDDLSEDLRVRAIDSLERSTRLQRQLINDLLDVSRIAKGKVDLDILPVDLRTIIETAVETLREAAARKRVEINVMGDPTVIEGDGGRLLQIVSNLVGNAIQFTPTGGSVDVSVMSEARTVVIQVSDTGIGIDPEFQPHVFDQFRQAEGGASRRHGGLGLGLAIVRQLAALHGGTVDVHSAGRGQGSTFTVRLPFLSDAGVSPNEPVGEEPRLPSVRVLFVEDDADARTLFAGALERAGAIVTTVSSSEEAIALLPKTPVDVLVSDIGLPGRDGVALIQHLHAKGYHPPALAVTAFAAGAERRRILSAGFHGLLEKPVTGDEVARAVETLLRERRRGGLENLAG